ncbi:ATP-dependent bile acid permease [Penicillium angulare]|uniref:ATP-dependent bile acid permease n=1 Tax=Penicillium angulare TaxID=116970 RepID=UPI002540B91B|nr:ATP-dependent bile acid permease [Penicillium angulare]KAJ5256557.1 ATP-dependent bile acid permease [Penicillium angulare]
MGALLFWFVVLLAFGFQQITSLATNLWIKKWALEFDKLNQLPPSEQVPGAVNSKHYLAVYALICLSFLLVSFLRDMTTFAGALKASTEIFDDLLNSILHASLIFFDKVPFGQITNRFFRDMSTIDQEVTVHSMSTLYTFCSLATVLILISAMLPVFLPVAAVIYCAYYVITNVYINSARDLKRMESVQQSPLYQHFGEALSGSISVRAYGQVKKFTEENHGLIDGFNRPYVVLWAVKEWLTVRVACLSAFISWLTGIFLLWRVDTGDIDLVTAGLVLTYAATFTENVLCLVQLYAIVQQSFNSVDRVLEYTELPSEPSEPIEQTPYDLSPQWPVRGSVRFEKYTTRYSPELDPVLSEITFDVPAKSRVAVVGRTGAGKSTLALALIRALEADSGQIIIDVVPQDPTLFNGTVGDNLDPLHQRSDNDIRDLLEELDFFRSLPAEILDNGAVALSLGQRQLVCLARALLRRPRVLILDEATASIDHATDALIQKALMCSVSNGTTILTIAHWLLSIADYDWLVVMDAGKVVEQGPAAGLLRRRGENAFFRQLCEQSGELAQIEQAAGVESFPR